MQTRGGFKAWLAAAAALVCFGVGVPYGVLSSTWAVPVFWCVFGVGVVALILIGTRGWRDAA